MSPAPARCGWARPRDRDGSLTSRSTHTRTEHHRHAIHRALDPILASPPPGGDRRRRRGHRALRHLRPRHRAGIRSHGRRGPSVHPHRRLPDHHPRSQARTGAQVARRAVPVRVPDALGQGRRRGAEHPVLPHPGLLGQAGWAGRQRHQRMRHVPRI
ncbi:hypothetical protein AES38_01150 [Clavibacter capsici]|nr:hypothetical protein AES38_01150 [Clavibacter capsici]